MFLVFDLCSFFFLSIIIRLKNEEIYSRKNLNELLFLIFMIRNFAYKLVTKIEYF
jgi:hypothetical protein